MECKHITYIVSHWNGISEEARAEQTRTMSLNARGVAEVIELTVTGDHEDDGFHPATSAHFKATYVAYSPYHGTAGIVTGVG
jgi:hypothetical protein